MKKSDFIKALEQIPGDPQVYVPKQSEHGDPGMFRVVGVEALDPMTLIIESNLDNMIDFPEDDPIDTYVKMHDWVNENVDIRATRPGQVPSLYDTIRWFWAVREATHMREGYTIKDMAAYLLNPTLIFTHEEIAEEVARLKQESEENPGNPPFDLRPELIDHFHGALKS